MIKPDNNPTDPLEASPPFESDDAIEKPLVIPVKSSASVLSISLDSNDRNEGNRPEQFTCPHCTKFKSNLESEYERHIVLNHPRKPGYPNTAAAG